MPVAVKFNAPELVPYRTTPVAERSVEKVTIALVVPERETFVPDVSGIRLSTIEVDPVLPAVSVAMTVTTFAHPVRESAALDHVPGASVADDPLTVTPTTHPASDTVPESVGAPVTVAPLA